LIALLSNYNDVNKIILLLSGNLDILAFLFWKFSVFSRCN